MEPVRDAPVFISYARSASKTAALALREHLGNQAYLDTEELTVGQTFPDRLIDALLNARVIVVFLSPEYFERPYCLMEFETALAPFEDEVAAGSDDKASLAPLIAVLPDQSAETDVLRHLPSPLWNVNWSRSDDLAPLAGLVEMTLRTSTQTIRDLLGPRSSDVRAKLLNVSALPSPLSLSGIPHSGILRASVGSDFVGRGDDIWRIHRELVTKRGASNNAARAVAVIGIGGMGKSQLAAEYLHRFGPQFFPGGVFWLDVERDMEEQQYSICGALDATIPSNPKWEQQIGDPAPKLRELLPGGASVGRILYVIDGLSEKHATQTIQTWCPAPEAVSLLITSRIGLSDPSVHLQSLEVGPVDSNSAGLLLRNQLSSASTISAKEWDEIAEWVGRMPLALTVLNAALKPGTLTPTVLLEKARNANAAQELETQASARANPSGHPVAGPTAAFQTSYERMSQSCQRLARRIAFFSAAPIPLALVQITLERRWHSGLE